MDTSGGRKFHGNFINEDFKTNKSASHETNEADNNDILEYINDYVVGKDQLFNGAFGDRRGISLNSNQHSAEGGLIPLLKLNDLLNLT